MTNIDHDAYRRQRESERAWLGRPLTIGTALALLATNLFVTLAIVLYLA